MSVTVDLADPQGAEAQALLAASRALLRSLFPPEANHFLDVETLAGPDMRFLVARLDGVAVGCAALALREGYGEIKSMFVAPEARRSGVAGALLARLEATARAAALPVLRLETGDTLAAAHALYRRSGFSVCGPFGDYSEAPQSVFMEKPLTD